MVKSSYSNVYIIMKMIQENAEHIDQVALDHHLLDERLEIAELKSLMQF